MAILNLVFDRKMVLTMEDYGEFISNILKLDIPFTIVQYSLTEHGVVSKINVPDEKVSDVMQVLDKNEIRVEHSTISINEDYCIDCLACVSLCNTGALYFDNAFKRQFDESKCVGCQLCVDGCPRNIITYQ